MSAAPFRSEPADPQALAEPLTEALTAGREEEGRRLLGALGFAEPGDAWRHLDALCAELPEAPRRELLHGLTPALAAAADANQALLDLLRYGEARFGREQRALLATVPAPTLAILCRLFGFSQFLADLLIRYPQFFEWLEEDPELGQPRTLERCLRQYELALGPFRRPAARRDAAIRCQRRELLRLGVRRMIGLSDEMQMAGELSELAAATLRVALREAYGPLEERHGTPMDDAEPGAAPTAAGFCVIGMGKLGGGELNFSSDIDVIFVYSAEGTTTGGADGAPAISNHQFFTRLAEAMLSWLTEHGPEGYLYRVDTRLRPEGESGPLTRSLAACEIYYATQARTWERLALLKARPVAGDERVARGFEALRRPFVFNPLHAEGLVGQVYELKGLIDGEVARRGDAGREIKRGRGGIREIEFLVQTQQLLHGGARPGLDSPSTLEALAALAREGLMPREEAERLRSDYIFLRTLEHRLQMEQLRQTHRLPDNPRELEALARRCGLTPRPGATPREQLQAAWRETTERVHAAFAKFFLPQGAEARPAPAPADEAERATRAVLSAEPEGNVLPALQPFELADGSALKTLRRLAGMGRTVYLSVSEQQQFERLLPILLRCLQRAPQPRVALAHFESFTEACGARAVFYETFAGAQPLLELLLKAFGMGEALAQTLIAHPEFVDYLSDLSLIAGPADPGAMGQRLSRWLQGARDEEAFCQALAYFRRFEYLMASLGELAGLLDYTAYCERLVATAERVLEQALARAAAERGLPPLPAGFAVMALGKLGGRELGFASDLDLIFVWEEPFGAGAGSAAEAAAALAERVLFFLTHVSAEGRAYAIDARLRPEGSGAPLAPHLTSYEEYYAQRAQPWELQTAMKLRWVAGDRALGARLTETVRERVLRRLPELRIGEEIRSMRRRIEDSVRNLPRWVFADFKKGRGGLMDLEFIAQHLQLTHLRDHPALLGLGTRRVLDYAREQGLLEAGQVDAIARDYIWCRRVELRARLLSGSDKTIIPSGGEKLAALERACRGELLAEGTTLQDEMARRLVRNRRHFEQIVR